MKSLALLTLVLGLLLSGCNPIKSTRTAESAAATFHQLFDAEDFETIYKDSHADFKATQPKAEILAFLQSVRKKTGKVKSATTTGWNVKSDNFVTRVVLTYAVDFENGPGTETFTYRIEDDTATLLGWHIDAPNLKPTATEKSNLNREAETK